MSAEHTPGPWWPILNSTGGWEVKTQRDAEAGSDKGIGGWLGANICTGIGDHTEARTRGNEAANARLIAAAPDLLAVLQQALPYLEKASATDNLVYIARLAIARATGARP